MYKGELSKNNESLALLEPAREYRTLVNLTEQYQASLREKETQTNLTPMFLHHTNVLIGSLPHSKDFRVDITPLTFRKQEPPKRNSPREAEQQTPQHEVYAEYYFPDSHQYFGFYTADAQSSPYTDRNFTIGSLITQEEISHLMHEFTNPPKEKMVRPPFYDLPRNSSFERGDTHHFLSFREVSPAFHLSDDRMDRAVFALEKMLRDQGGESLDLISKNKWDKERKLLTQQTEELRSVTGQRMQKTLQAILRSLNLYRQTGKPVPETMDLISDDDSTQISISIPDQRVSIETNPNYETLEKTIHKDSSEERDLKTHEYPHIMRALLPHLKEIVQPNISSNPKDTAA